MPPPNVPHPYQDKGFRKARVHEDFRRGPDGNIKKPQPEKHGSPQVLNTSLPPFNVLFGIHHNVIPMTPIHGAHSWNPMMIPSSEVFDPPNIEMSRLIPLGGDYRFLNQPIVPLNPVNIFQFKPKKSNGTNCWTKKLDNLVKSIPSSTPPKPVEFKRVSKKRAGPSQFSFYQPPPSDHFMPMFAPGVEYQQNDPLFKMSHSPFNSDGFEVPTPGFIDNAQSPLFDYPSVEEEPEQPQPPPAETPVEIEEEEKEMTVEEIIESLDSINSYGSKPSVPPSPLKSHPTDPHPSFSFSKPFEF
ncbi:unnamed protein product [Caenorhabditis brenneri]